MKTITRIIFASTLAAIAPTFAHAAYLENASQIRATGTPAKQVPVTPSVRGLDAMAYAPAETSGNYVRDLGIGSQR